MNDETANSERSTEREKRASTIADAAARRAVAGGPDSREMTIDADLGVSIGFRGSVVSLPDYPASADGLPASAEIEALGDYSGGERVFLRVSHEGEDDVYSMLTLSPDAAVSLGKGLLQIGAAAGAWEKSPPGHTNPAEKSDPLVCSECGTPLPDADAADRHRQDEHDGDAEIVERDR